MFAEWLERIADLTGISPATQVNILISVLIVLILWLTRALVVRAVWRRTEDVRTRYLWRKTAAYLTTFLILILVGLVWVKAIRGITTFLGLLSAGVAIALRDILTNFAGWLYILTKKPFILSDRVQVGKHAGDVVDISVLHFTLLEIGNWVHADQSTGRVIHVPNSVVFTRSLANFTRGFEYIWNEIPVLLTFESNWEKAKGILQEVADRHSQHRRAPAAEKVLEASRRYMIFYPSLTPTVYTTVKDSGVLLTIRYLTEPRLRRGTQQAIWEDILRAFAKCEDIDFAYPTQRFYDSRREGKPSNSPDRESPPPPETPMA